MYLDEQKLLLCGIDHGFSTMKTAHFVFENGVKELGGEASLLTNTMFFNERYFKVGEGRIPLKDTKVKDGDYFLLTLAAIAREMDYHGLSDTEICIAAGLPFTRFGQEKAEFKEYLNPGDREFQYNGKEYNNGDWKYKFQPITNKLCEEYGLHVTPAEYSKEATNVSRQQWEREQTFSKWIEQDARFCALNAENMKHFIFLLEKQGFEVKQGEHIAVKVPGMKRFKRLDTISEDFNRENLEAMFKYGNASLASPVNHAMPLIPIRKAILTRYQRKCYARMYRLRLAEKKRFTYKSAYLYEQIQKMHELQEEYLVVVNYDVKSFVDLVHLKIRLQRVDEELCKIQKEMYQDRASQKRACKTAEDLAFFEASENGYRERLEQIKLQKKNNHKKLKTVERCLERDGSTLDAELEYRIPVGNMDDLTEVARDEVLGNPHRQMEDLVVSQVISEDITDEIAADVEDRDTADMKLPADKADYMRMSVAEKVFCYPFDTKGIESAFEMVRAYFEKIDMDTGFHSVYEEAKFLSDYYEKQKVEEFIGERAERVIETMKLLGIDAGRMAEYSIAVLSEVFSFGDMEYFAGIKLFNRVVDRLEINMEKQKRYEVFDRIYEEGMQKKDYKYDRYIR